MDLSNLTVKHFVENKSQCLEQIKSEISKIPSLNEQKPETFKNYSLVKFSGYIQDLQEPEYYLEKYEVKSSDGSTRIENGMYRDSFDLKEEESVDHNSENKTLAERRSMFVVELPGINDWAKKGKQAGKNLNAENILNSPTSSKKREIEEEPMEVDDSSKKLATDKNPGASNDFKNTLSAVYLLNSPIPSRPSPVCMIRIYEDLDAFILNSIVEVVGFISTEFENPAASDDDFGEEMEKLASNPPTSLIPRIHAVYVRELPHNNPLFYNEPEAIEEPEIILLCKDLHKVLTQCLLGDSVCAHYLLCHFISNVYVRAGVDALGKFTLNISHIPSEVLPSYTNSLYEIVEMLLPVSHYLPMTIDSFNSMQFVPKKDYKTNKLTTGILQLAKHTHLVLDETRMEPGKLNPEGVKAVSSISDLIKSQQVNYDFVYYDIAFDTSIPILILSEGKSLLPSDYHVPLKPDEDAIRLIKETIEAGKHFLKPKLNSLRKCLTQLRIKEFLMGTEDTSFIQKDFITMRQERNATADDLHLHLVLSRLVALTNGKSKLDLDSWEQSKKLEEERVNRVFNLKKQKNEQ